MTPVKGGQFFSPAPSVLSQIVHFLSSRRDFGPRRRLSRVRPVRQGAAGSLRIHGGGFGGGAAEKRSALQLHHCGPGWQRGGAVLRQLVFTTEQDQEAAVELRQKQVKSLAIQTLRH